jgi:hypothetical protein
MSRIGRAIRATRWLIRATRALQFARTSGAMRRQRFLGKCIELACLSITFNRGIEPHGIDCKDRNSDARGPAWSVLTESFNERSVDLRDRWRDDVVRRISIDHHMGAEMIALQVFSNRFVSPLADFRDVA